MSPSPFSQHPIPPPESAGAGLKIPILFGIVIALVAANIYLFMQIDGLKTEIAKSRESILNEVSSVRETSSISTATSQRRVETLQAQLEAAQRRAQAAAGEAKEEALKQVELLEKKVAVESKKAQEEVKQQITQVEQKSSEQTAKLGQSVSEDIGKVRTDVASTKSELDKTISDLKKVTGDLGVTSGYVATNGKEISALRQLGERSIYEFNLVKSKQPFKLSDVTIQLKSADLKRNKYTIELVADDKHVEKKDKGLNEPVQFYLAKYKQPCEIVVNEIKKDRIVGYLSQPKVLASKN